LLIEKHLPIEEVAPLNALKGQKTSAAASSAVSSVISTPGINDDHGEGHIDLV